MNTSSPSRGLLAVVLLTGVAVLVFRTLKTDAPVQPTSETTQPAASAQQPDIFPQQPASGSTAAPVRSADTPTAAPAKSTAASMVASGAPMPAAGNAAPPAPAPAQDEIEAVRGELDALTLSFRDFRTAVGENPVGTNAEITEALLGRNAKQTKVSIPGGSTVANGELVDRYGTPYFFHQLSATEMEIRSAGRDRKLYTPDDIVVK